MTNVKTLALTILTLSVVMNPSRGDSIRASSTHHLHPRIHHLEREVHRLDVEVNRLERTEARSSDSATTSTTTTATHAAAENLATIHFGSNYAPPAVNAPSATPSPTINITGTSLGNAFVATSGSPVVSMSPSADAFINFGSGPYAESSTLTTGNPQSFLNSPVFNHLFGPGGPTSQDISHFESQVLSTIQTTYNSAGLAIHLTSDPNASAAHTMSVVSGASYSGNSNAIGITDIGHNGFSFIDKFSGVQTETDLATAIGHNLAHELMHAFGIANHPEQLGPYVDAAATSLSTLTDPSTGFSPAAAALLSTLNFQNVGQSVMAQGQNVDGAQAIIATGTPTPAPEPSTMLAWGLALAMVGVARHRRINAGLRLATKSR